MKQIFVSFVKFRRNVIGKKSFSDTKKTLGRNFISPSDLEKYFPGIFTKELKKVFQQKLSTKIIKFCKKNDFLLIPNILLLFSLETIFQKEDFFYNVNIENCFEKKVSKHYWIAVSKKPYSMSYVLGQKKFYIPNISELVLIAFVCKKFDYDFMFYSFVLSSSKFYSKDIIIPENICIINQKGKFFLNCCGSSVALNTLPCLKIK